MNVGTEGVSKNIVHFYLSEGDDIEVINIYRESCRYLGYGIVNIVNTYNPTVIILGDELTHVDQEIMLNEVDKVLKERLLPEIY